MTHDRLTPFLSRIRRRLRVAWALDMATVLAPVVLGVAVVLVGIGRLRPWAWTDPAALAVVVAGVVGVLIASVVLRIGAGTAARAADRGLGTKDRFATALEMEGREDGFADLVRSDAQALAAGRSAADAVPLRANGRRLGVVAILAVLALVGALAPNAQDEVRERQRAQQALLAEEAEKLDEASRELAESPEATEAERDVSSELAELAEALREAPDLDAGTDAVDRKAAELGSRLDEDLLSQKAAVRGLDRSLASDPLPGMEEGTSSQDQLSGLADELSELSEEEREALAERLSDLADTQAAGNPEAAGALDRAASELDAGDLESAAEALRGAGEAQRAASGDVDEQAAAAEAVGALGQVRERLSQGSGQSDGAQGQDGNQGEGEGEGQGQGQGQGEGQGQGQGQGEGEGQGQGQGQGEGEGQGQGQGRGGGGQGLGPGEVAEPEVFTPVEPGEGERLELEGQEGEPSGEITGRSEGLSTEGGASVPLSRVYPRYRERASRALDSLDLPPSVRSLVRSYFDSLGDL